MVQPSWSLMFLQPSFPKDIFFKFVNFYQICSDSIHFFIKGMFQATCRISFNFFCHIWILFLLFVVLKNGVDYIRLRVGFMMNLGNITL